MRWLLALASGAAITLALAPFDLWPLAVLAPGILYLLLRNTSTRQALMLGGLFGFGLFASGVSWVYVSIHDYGNAPPWLAAFLTLIFVSTLALFYSLLAWLWVRFLRQPRPGLLDSANFAALWLLLEIVRGWIFTGFPWLYLGYSQLQGPLAGLAPLGGVWLISAVLVFSGCALVTLATNRAARRQWPAFLLTLAPLWLAGGLLQLHSWTTATGKPLSVTAVQGNIEQSTKWNPDQVINQLHTYQRLSLASAPSDLLIWPENAIPVTQHMAAELLDDLQAFARHRNSTLITGIPLQESATEGYSMYYNGILGLGSNSSSYKKQKLVPFGEYVPLQQSLRGLIEFFDLPMSDFYPGPARQAPIQAGDYQIAPYICYEVVYPEFARQLAAQSQLLLTISNDAWFGDSIGPLQHLQMAQMRALESGRWMIRATNNGVTAFIDQRGHIRQQLPRFSEGVLTGQVQPMHGTTPYTSFGILPWALLAAILLGTSLWLRRKHAAPVN